MECPVATSKKKTKALPKKSSSMRWYENHREEHNARRRERYRNNPKYREAILRDKRKRSKLATIKPRMHWVGATQVKVWTTGAIASELGCSGQLIRTWEANGYVPLPTVKGVHRLYLQHQRDIIKDIHSLIASSQADKFTEETVVLLKELKEKW